MSDWFYTLSPKLKKLTIIFSFIAAFGTAWTILKVVGIDILDFTIGCSSVSTTTELNSKRLDTLYTEKYWKSIRSHRQDSLNLQFDSRLDRLEKKRK